MSGQQHDPAALYPWERHCTHFTGGLVGPRAGLDGRKASSTPGFDPGSSSPYSGAVPTEVIAPFIYNKNSTLSGHISTFIMTYSGHLRKQILELSKFQRIVGSQMLTDYITGM